MDKCDCGHNHNCLEELNSDHQKILNSFEELEKTISKNPIDREKVREFLAFTQNFSEPHHQKEEKVLFPMLEKKGIPNEGGPVGMMLLEHETQRANIKKIKEGIDGNDEEKIKANSIAAIALMREHIFKEDNILYPCAKDVLTAEELVFLGEECAKILN